MINESLVRAIASKDVGKMEEILNSGLDINARDKKGRTYLHLAINREFVEGVKLLLRRGADPTLRDRKERTPLDIAMTKYIEVSGFERSSRLEEIISELSKSLNISEPKVVTKKELKKILDFPGHFLGTIFHVSWSSDDSSVAISTVKGEVALFNIQGERLFYKNFAKPWGIITAVPFSDGKKLLLGTKSPEVWDLSTKKRESKLKGKFNTGSGVFLSPDERLAAIYDPEGTGFLVWNIHQRELVLRKRLSRKFGDPLRSLTFSPDSNKLVLADSAGRIFIVDIYRNDIKYIELPKLPKSFTTLTRTFSEEDNTILEVHARWGWNTEPEVRLVWTEDGIFALAYTSVGQRKLVPMIYRIEPDALKVESIAIDSIIETYVEESSRFKKFAPFFLCGYSWGFAVPIGNTTIFLNPSLELEKKIRGAVIPSPNGKFYVPFGAYISFSSSSGIASSTLDLEVTSFRLFSSDGKCAIGGNTPYRSLLGITPMETKGQTLYSRDGIYKIQYIRRKAVCEAIISEDILAFSHSQVGDFLLIDRKGEKFIVKASEGRVISSEPIEIPDGYSYDLLVSPDGKYLSVRVDWKIFFYSWHKLDTPLLLTEDGYLGHSAAFISDSFLVMESLGDPDNPPTLGRVIPAGNRLRRLKLPSLQEIDRWNLYSYALPVTLNRDLIVTIGATKSHHSRVNLLDEEGKWKTLAINIEHGYPFSCVAREVEGGFLFTGGELDIFFLKFPEIKVETIRYQQYDYIGEYFIEGLFEGEKLLILSNRQVWALNARLY